MIQKTIQKRSKNDLKNKSKTIQKKIQKRSKNDSKNDSKMIQKTIHDRFWIVFSHIFCKG